MERLDTSAPGQALEFSIWSDLIKQSRGALHVFLPLLDRGLDAVIHRLTDGQYIPVQVKGRGEMEEGMVEIVVRGDSLVDDRALLIATLLDPIPGQMDLVVEEGVFRGLAARDMSNGHEVFSAAFSMHPTDRTHWRPYLLPREQLAERILGVPVTEALGALGHRLELPPADRHNAWLGFLGEAEVIRRLAESPRLDLFRPFPDLEMVEVLARDNVTGNFTGLQVKTATQAAIYGEAHIHIRKATLSQAGSTWLIGLAWLQEPGRFDDELLLIPAADLPRIAVDDGNDLVINFHPSSPERTRLDAYRHRVAAMANLIVQTCAAAGYDRPA
ncbi:hypothetical protein EPN29_04540 [bacterium]|nr:MAG: hypothetical protein EPN29_04540 [bacterium]